MKPDRANKIGPAFARRYIDKCQQDQNNRNMTQHNRGHVHQFVRATFDQGIPDGMHQGSTHNGKKDGQAHGKATSVTIL